MISNGLRRNPKIISPSIFLFILIITPTINCALYPYGIENGDTKIDWSTWDLGSEEFNLDTSMPLLGKGMMSSLWINTIGALSYRQLKVQTAVTSIVDNILLAPYYVQSKETADSAVYYRQTNTDSALFEAIEDDFETALFLPPTETDVVSVVDFRPTYALVVTWSNMSSPTENGKVNSFQIVLTTDGKYSFAIYNYGELEWSASRSGKHAAAGIFASSNSDSSCNYELPYSQTSQISSISTADGNSGEMGRFILIISEPFECTSNFESACEEAPPSSDWGSTKPYFGISRGSWDVYSIHTCNVGFQIRPGVSTERINCVYDADYYNSVWERDASKCLDLNATKTFVVNVEVSKVGNDSVVPPGGLTDEDKDELKKVLEEAVKSIVNLTDVIVTITNITTTNESTPIQRTKPKETVTVTTTIHVPPYIHKKITADNITDIITETITKNEEIGGVTFIPVVEVIETTDKCLQGCMCRFNKSRTCPRGNNPMIKPDSCCGGCNGKPYSSTIKACCNNFQIYDPLKARCCNGRVRKGATSKCP